MINKNTFKLTIISLMALTILMLMHHFHLNNYLSVAGFNNYRVDLLNYEAHSPDLFVVYYVFAYIILITCCVPGTIVFDILAGFLFGYYWGSILVVGSYMVGSLCNFILVRYFFKDVLSHKFMKFKHLIHGHGKYALMLNLISLRMVAVIPFWAVNIVAALLNVRLRTFLVATIIGIIPSSIIYVVIGNDVHDMVASSRGLDPYVLLNIKIIAPLFALAILLMLPNVLKIFGANNSKTTISSTPT